MNRAGTLAVQARLHHLISYLFEDPLRRNSMFLIMTNGTSALLGFLFWTVAARLYSPTAVGLGTALVSAASWLAALSGVGLGVGLVRYLPEREDKTGMINSCLTIVSLLAAVLALAFVAGLPLWSPALSFMGENAAHALIFVALTVSLTVSALQSNVFIAFRSTQFSFIQILISASRIFLVALVAGLAMIGISLALAIAMLVAVLAGNVFLRHVHPGYRPAPTVDRQSISDMIHFSFGNYVGDSFRVLSPLVLPMIIVNVLSPEMGAYFFIGWLIPNLLFTTSNSISFTLLAEASHARRGIRHQVGKAAQMMFLLLVPGMTILLVFGGPILSLFGPRYSVEALSLLRILAVASLPVGINELFVATNRIAKHTRPVICVYGFVAAGTVGGGYLLLGSMGLAGMGVAWLVSNTIAAVVTFPIMMRQIKAMPTSVYAG